MCNDRGIVRHSCYQRSCGLIDQHGVCAGQTLNKRVFERRRIFTQWREAYAALLRIDQSYSGAIKSGLAVLNPLQRLYAFLKFSGVPNVVLITKSEVVCFD